MHLIILSLLTIITLSSCSSINMIKPKTKKVLTLRDKRILYYRNLRKTQWGKIKKRRPRHVTLVPKRIKHINKRDQFIEIEQNLNYYCMENRKKSMFHIKNSCIRYTHSIYNGCLRSFDKGDERLTKCVKSRLR